MFGIQYILEERRSTLDTLMTELLVSEISEKEAIYFKSDEILSLNQCNAFIKRFDGYIGNFIYRIDLVNRGDVKKAQKSFKLFQQSNKLLVNGNKRNMTRFNEVQSKTLYVGVKQSRLKIRIKQHLGCGPSRTLSLHLNHWIPKDIQLKISVYNIASDNNEFTNFLEQGFWDSLAPMFGRRKDV